MISRIKAAVVALVSSPAVRSVARHAALAGGAVLLAALTVGGVHAITTAVVISAGAAALRAASIGVIALIKSRTGVDVAPVVDPIIAKVPEAPAPAAPEAPAPDGLAGRH